MRSFTSPCLLLEKKYMRSENLFCHHLQSPDTGTMKTCSSEEIFQGQSSSLQWFLKQVVISRQQLHVPLRKLDEHHPLWWFPKSPPEVRQWRPTRWTPAEHTRRRKYFSPLRCPEEEDQAPEWKVTPLHTWSTCSTFFFLIRPIWRMVKFFRTIHPLKNGRLETRSSAPIQVGH